MMASTTNVVLGAAAAMVLWTFVGLAAARVVMPERPLAWPIAPALGWAVHSAVTLPLFTLIGFTRIGVAIVTVVVLAACAFALRLQGPGRDTASESGVPIWAWIGAALVAVGPAIAILPKIDGDSVYLAAQVFDHSKIAMIDEMVRNGLPPANPFFGPPGQPSRLVYYYLMHFSAAELALLFGLSGWEGDAALTWFTAFASLMLMIGLAIWLGGRRIAAFYVLLACAAGSLRPLLAFIPGIDSIVMPASGFGGWLFQTAWAPQHLAAASCVVLAILLLIELARRDSSLLLVTLALVVVAGYQSSVWVGGVAFAVAAAWTGCVLLAGMEPRHRLPFLGRCVVAALCAAALAAPMLSDQSAAMASRGIAWPVAIQSYGVLGDAVPERVRRILDLPAYWLVLLVIALPSIYITGLLAMRSFSRDGALDPARKPVATILIHLTAASLSVSWLMVSTVGGGNDLGWRAALPGIMVLTVFAAAGLAHWLAVKDMGRAAGAIFAIAIGVATGSLLVYDNATGVRTPAAKTFAKTPDLWMAVRRHAGPTDRVANNPVFLREMTPWPANISWALLSNRRSCFASYDLGLPFIPLPLRRLGEINLFFIRVFSGEISPDDLHELTTRYDCRVAVITELDGAWTHDPFAVSPHWRLVESSARGWRIYVTRPYGTASREGPTR